MLVVLDKDSSRTSHSWARDTKTTHTLKVNWNAPIWLPGASDTKLFFTLTFPGAILLTWKTNAHHLCKYWPQILKSISPWSIFGLNCRLPLDFISWLIFRMDQKHIAQNRPNGGGGSLERLPLYEDALHLPICWEVLPGDRNVLLSRQRVSGQCVWVERERLTEPSSW